MLNQILTILLILMISPLSVLYAETIDVQIKGFDDGLKTTKQQDYKEAVLFAKREAIERAGVNIKSITTVKDMMLESDLSKHRQKLYSCQDIIFWTWGIQLMGHTKLF